MILAGVSAFIYALNRLLIIPMLPEIGFFNKYLGDMLALPVYLPLSFYLAWRLHLIPEDFQLQLTHIIGAGIIFSILFEGIIPILGGILYQPAGKFKHSQLRKIYATVFISRKHLETGP